MKSIDVTEMRLVEGGTTYVCKCGYKCNAWYKCVSHTCTAHYKDVLKLWGDLFGAARKIFGV